MSREARNPLSGATLLILVLGVIGFGGVVPLRGLLPPGSFWEGLLAGSLVPDPVRRMVTAACAALLAWLAAAEILGATRRPAESPERAENRRRMVVWILAILLILIPAVIHSIQRHRTGSLQFTHDGGVLYAEGAMEALLRGENPYSVSYADGPLGTKFAQDRYWGRRSHEHILTFQPYLPLTFLLGLPLKGLTALAGLAYDQRLLHLLHLVGLLLLLPRMVPREKGSLAQAVVVLNPTFSHYVIRGTNDVVLIFWLLLALHLLANRRMRAAAWTLGLAAASKQFAWVILPLAAACWAPAHGAALADRARALLKGALRLWPVAVVLALTAGPFFLWSPADFIEDALLLNFGLTDAKYPYGGTPGYGLANFPVALGWIDSLEDEFPLNVGQLLIFLPLYVLFLGRLLREPSARLLAATYGVSLFVFLLFGRMFHYNYFGVLAAVLAVGWLGEEPDQAEVTASDGSA